MAASKVYLVLFLSEEKIQSIIKTNWSTGPGIFGLRIKVDKRTAPYKENVKSNDLEPEQQLNGEASDATHWQVERFRS